MKTSFTQKPYSLICILVALFCGCAASVNAHEQDTLACLEISGRLHKLKNLGTDFYKVELMYNGRVIDSMKIKDRKEFKFKLHRNTVYGLRITKQGYIDRNISINTSLPEYADRVFRFEFDTELIAQEESQSLNKDALDFPVAIICFNHELKCFYYDEEYTSLIKRRIYLGEKF